MMSLLPAPLSRKQFGNHPSRRRPKPAGVLIATWTARKKANGKIVCIQEVETAIRAYPWHIIGLRPCDGLLIVATSLSATRDAVTRYENLYGVNEWQTPDLLPPVMFKT